MPLTVHLEAAIDRAKNRLEAMEKAEGECQSAIEAAVNALQLVVKFSDKDRNRAIESLWEEVGDLTSDARDAIEREISEAEEALADIEYADLQRSSPVTL